MKIFNEYNFDESEVDFISIIIKHMKSIYNDALISTIILKFYMKMKHSMIFIDIILIILIHQLLGTLICHLGKK